MTNDRHPSILQPVVAQYGAKVIDFPENKITRRPGIVEAQQSRSDRTHTQNMSIPSRNYAHETGLRPIRWTRMAGLASGAVMAFILARDSENKGVAAANTPEICHIVVETVAAANRTPIGEERTALLETWAAAAGHCFSQLRHTKCRAYAKTVELPTGPTELNGVACRRPDGVWQSLDLDGSR